MVIADYREGRDIMSHRLDEFDRSDDVIDLFLAGEPVDVVAAEFGLSRAEVEDVLRASARPAA